MLPLRCKLPCDEFLMSPPNRRPCRIYLLLLHTGLNQGRLEPMHTEYPARDCRPRQSTPPRTPAELRSTSPGGDNTPRAPPKSHLFRGAIPRCSRLALTTAASSGPRKMFPGHPSPGPGHPDGAAPAENRPKLRRRRCPSPPASSTSPRRATPTHSMVNFALQHFHKGFGAAFPLPDSSSIVGAPSRPRDGTDRRPAPSGSIPWHGLCRYEIHTILPKERMDQASFLQPHPSPSWQPSAAASSSSLPRSRCSCRWRA
mmetsp:Transcript_30517/g.64836  ORF Transcript_30517/g.64836 Transcript_30517/m.64836 type:complete len:257 (-) Transcript_30517:3531-4301(-)